MGMPIEDQKKLTQLAKKVLKENDGLINRFDNGGDVRIPRSDLDFIFEAIFLLGFREGFKDSMDLFNKAAMEHKLDFIKEGMSNGQES